MRTEGKEDASSVAAEATRQGSAEAQVEAQAAPTVLTAEDIEVVVGTPGGDLRIGGTTTGDARARVRAVQGGGEASLLRVPDAEVAEETDTVVEVPHQLAVVMVTRPRGVEVAADLQLETVRAELQKGNEMEDADLAQGRTRPEGGDAQEVQKAERTRVPEEVLRQEHMTE